MKQSYFIHTLVFLISLLLIPLLMSRGSEAVVANNAAPSGEGKPKEPVSDSPAVETAGLKTLSQIIERASEKKIVYVGEYHDHMSHHLVELQVIKDLFKKNPHIAVGMEMFQRPFQPALDEFIRGTIEEREFLKKTEYFSRWSYDYNLYKPILDFARTEKIPVVALNLRREITDKVAKSGLSSLTADEKLEIPGQMDFSDKDYRDRLKGIFEQHKDPEGKKFDFFFEAQVLWDETMAMSIDEYLRKNPDQQMVVIAGEGHLAYDAGIPQRTFRRNGYPFTTILCDADVDRGIGNFLVYPKDVEGPTAPKLMVLLKDDGGRVVVTGLPPDSVARKAGIEVGDVLLALDGSPMKTIDDVRIILFYKHSGELLKVNVLRKRFLFGAQEREIDVHLE